MTVRGGFAALILTCGVFAAPVYGQANISPFPASSASPNAPKKVVATAATRAQALKLAEILNSEAITRRQIERAYTITMPVLIKNRPEFQEIEKLYPGISDIAVKAEREIIEPETIANLPKLHQVIANVYADYLTAADIAAVTEFYGSPTGAKALSAATEGNDLSHMIEKNLSGQEPNVVADDVRQMAGGAAPQFLANLNGEDRKKLISFGLSSSGRAWRAIQPLILQAVADQANVTNRSTAMNVAAEHVLSAITDYIKQQDANQSVGAAAAK